MRSRGELIVRLEARGGRLIRALDRARGILGRRNRPRRAPIRCRLGLHHWEAFELEAGLSFRARCRRPGCRAVKIYKPRALGPTERAVKGGRI